MRQEAERLRLYYVAMTRAIDRLIVSGAIEERRRRPWQEHEGVNHSINI